MFLVGWFVAVKRDDAKLIEICREDMKRSVFARADSDMRREPESHGHDKTIVVIGVLTDKIDSARRAKNNGIAPKLPAIHVRCGTYWLRG